MSSRNLNSRHQKPLDNLGLLIRESLLSRTAFHRPVPGVRRRLLLCAAEQQRRRQWLRHWLMALLAAPPSEFRVDDWQQTVWSRLAYFELQRNLIFAGVLPYKLY